MDIDRSTSLSNATFSGNPRISANVAPNLEAHVDRGRFVMQRQLALWNERRIIVERDTHLVGSEDEAHHVEERLDEQDLTYTKH